MLKTNALTRGNRFFKGVPSRMIPSLVYVFNILEVLVFVASLLRKGHRNDASCDWILQHYNINCMKKQFQKISFFTHVWEKVATVISIEDFWNDVRGSRWGVVTLAYRRWLDEHRPEEARKLKANLPGVVVAGVCRGGHAASQVRELSGLSMFDLDHTDERTDELVALFRTLPYVVLQFVSISGRGIKVVVRTDVETPAEYAASYPVVARELERLGGHPCDMACRDLGRACYGSHDPQAYYNPDAEPFAWREAPLEEVAAGEATVGEALPIGEAKGFVPAFVASFGERNPFVVGSRHDFILKLGRAARYKGFSQAEMSRLLENLVAEYARPDFLASEIEKTLVAGYQYANSRPLPEMPKRQDRWVQGPPMPVAGPQVEEEEEAEMSEKEEELRRQAPCFPEELFARLPPMLAEGVALARDARERDMLLMGMLVNMSACLPEVRILYDQMYCSLHFYYLAIAHAGGGKGVLALAGMLPSAIHEFYEKQNQEAKAKYEAGVCAWDLERTNAQREKRLPDFTIRPEEPRRRLLTLSPNISKSQLIACLEDNGKLGAVINAPELDMVSGAIRQDCGKHDDVFRAAFHHEVVSADFKVNGRQIVAHNPHLAFCAAGTPSQLPNFVSSLENGLYSRIAFYVGQGEWKWRSAAPRKAGHDFRAVFRQLSERLLEMHLYLLQSPTEVVFTPAQWQEHTERFTRRLEEVVSEKNDSPGAIVLRHGLIAIRIAGVLTTLRKCECAWRMTEYICADDDFHTAMQLTDVLLEHSLLLSTSLLGRGKLRKPLSPYFRLRPILNKMKGKFTYKELMDEATTQGLPATTFKRLLKKVVALKVVVKEEDGYRKRGRSGAAD